MYTQTDQISFIYDSSWKREGERLVKKKKRKNGKNSTFDILRMTRKVGTTIYAQFIRAKRFYLICGPMEEQ